MALSPAIAIPNVPIEPVVEATVPATNGAIFSDLEICYYLSSLVFEPCRN